MSSTPFNRRTSYTTAYFCLTLWILRLVDRREGQGRGAIVAGCYGQGRVLTLSPHAEGGEDEMVLVHAIDWLTRN